MKEYELPKDELLIKLILQKNQLVAYCLDNIYTFNVEIGFEKIVELDESEVLFASADGKCPVVIRRNKAGNIALEIYDDEVYEVEVENIPEDLKALNDKICVDFGDEIAIFNTRARIVSKIRLSNKIEKMHIYNNGKNLAVMYRDKVELYDI
jgi:hypothetical protein